jgi:hypothetical protein
LCIEEWQSEYTGYFTGSVSLTRKSHGIDCKGSTAVDGKQGREGTETKSQQMQDEAIEKPINIINNPKKLKP